MKHHGRSARPDRGSTSGLNQPQLRRMDAGKDALHRRAIEPVHASKKTGEHGPIVGQDRVIAVLEQGCLIYLDLLTKNTTAIDAAAEHPIDTAMTVVGAVVTVLAEGTAELIDCDDDRVTPGRRPDLFRKAGKPTPEFAETIGEVAVGRTLVDMGVPSADIDKAKVELLTHQPADPPRGQLKPVRRDGAAISCRHLLRDRAIDIVTHAEALRHCSRKIALRVHVTDQLGLAIVDAGLADI